MQLGLAKNFLQYLLWSNCWYITIFLLKLKIKSRLLAVLIKAVASDYLLGERKIVLLDELAFKLPCAVCCSFCSSKTGVEQSNINPEFETEERFCTLLFRLTRVERKKTNSILLALPLPFLPQKFCKTYCIW